MNRAANLRRSSTAFFIDLFSHFIPRDSIGRGPDAGFAAQHVNRPGRSP